MAPRAARSVIRRAGVVAWHLGQVIGGLFLLGAVLVATQTAMRPAEQACTAALLLLGIAALVAGRVLRYAATRGRRRRIHVH